MARKSRKIDFVNVDSKTLAAAAETTAAEKVSHAALYARLSFESDKNRERNTIETQMALLHTYVEEHKDIVAVKEYFDISKTGTNFEREGFDEMMQDIKKGEVDCVIVKDLSRLGRNYVEAGSYIERVFPFFDVRFISVNDNYDSARDDVSLLIGMSNIYNEFYSRDLAKKIRTSHRAVWVKGGFSSGSVAYGYEKEKNGSHRLVPDPVTAPVVKKIFQLALDGETTAGIVRCLNEQGLLSPLGYKLEKNGKGTEKSRSWEWRAGTVTRILGNQYYAGDSVHNQYIYDTWGVKKRGMNPRDEWIIVENTHEALIDRSDFEEIQRRKKINATQVQEARKKGRYSVDAFNFFKSKVVCGDCGRKMLLTGYAAGNKVFKCSGYSRRHGCSSHRISDIDLNEYVLRIIRSHINIYTEYVDLIQRLNERQESVKKYDVFSREIRKCREALKRMKKHRERLFEDYAYKLIDAEQYETFSQQDTESEKAIRENIELLVKKQAGYEKDFHTDKEWSTLIDKYRNIRTLNKSLVDAFVDKVEVFENQYVVVHLIYDDMLEELRQYAKEREVELCN